MSLFRNMALTLWALLLYGLGYDARAQDFEWVYEIDGDLAMNVQQGVQDGVRSDPYAMATDAQNNIYVLASSWGYHRFRIGGQTVRAGSILPSGHNLIFKLDKDKNVLWVRELRRAADYDSRTLKLDSAGNVWITGVATPLTSSLFLNPAAESPATQLDLTPRNEYSYILKLDANGQYQQSWISDERHFSKLDFDSNGDLFLITKYLLSDQVFLSKHHPDFSLVWERPLPMDVNLNYVYSNHAIDVQFDSQNRIYLYGMAKSSITFGGTAIDVPPGQFQMCLARLGADSSEDWIRPIGDLWTTLYGLNPYHSQTILIDDSDHLYLTRNYREAESFSFSNATVSDLPYEGGIENVLFKLDSEGNYLWHVPVTGEWNQYAADIVRTATGDILMGVVFREHLSHLRVGDAEPIPMNGATSALIRFTADGLFSDVKRLEADIWDLHVDSEDHILVSGSMMEPGDINPHPFEEVILTPDYYPLYVEDIILNAPEILGYVLKLSPCDMRPLYDDTYLFCSQWIPQPTIADILPGDPSVRWYTSMTSATPLAPGYALTPGQTYYYEKTSYTCPPSGRLPVRMEVDGPPPPPVAGLQPCYFEGMTLADLAVEGQNVKFYRTSNGNELIPITHNVNKTTTYYAAQRGATGCESPRVAVTVSDSFLPVEYRLKYCGAGTVPLDLSEYEPFLLAGRPASDYSFSYHMSYEGAFADTDPVPDPERFPATESAKVFIRAVSAAESCFKVVEATFHRSTPPVIEKVVVTDLQSNNSIAIYPKTSLYSYSIDGSVFHSSNYFEDLPSGQLNAYIRDYPSCISDPVPVFLLSYPKFFTPNGDGVNDFWRIDFAIFQEALDVAIYDRYGRLITAFGKSESGWDGTYKGRPLPADDYWFVITRDRATVTKGHFSLVR